jgi:hypothetical protein
MLLHKCQVGRFPRDLWNSLVLDSAHERCGSKAKGFALRAQPSQRNHASDSGRTSRSRRLPAPERGEWLVAKSLKTPFLTASSCS